jgi:hypothetical protein
MSEPPKKTGADVAHALVKAAVAAVPVAGGAGAELFALIVAPPLERRRDRWLAELAAAVDEIRARASGLTPEKLSENDSFVTALLHATQIASRSHQDEKIRTLRNAIVNSALPGAPNETLQAIFLRYVDELTPWHLRVLSFFRDPGAVLQPPGSPRAVAAGNSPSSALEQAIPELRGQRAFYDQLVFDLESRGLMSGNIHSMTSGPGVLAPRTKPFGSEFVLFISETPVVSSD